MERQKRHRAAIEAGDHQFRTDPIQVESNHRCSGVSSLHLREWKTVHNNDHGGKVGKSIGARTKEHEER